MTTSLCKSVCLITVFALVSLGCNDEKHPSTDELIRDRAVRNVAAQVATNKLLQREVLEAMNSAETNQGMQSMTIAELMWHEAELAEKDKSIRQMSIKELCTEARTNEVLRRQIIEAVVDPPNQSTWIRTIEELEARADTNELRRWKIVSAVYGCASNTWNSSRTGPLN